MKLLIMCEGPNELKIINILLENQKLKFSSYVYASRKEFTSGWFLFRGVL